MLRKSMKYLEVITRASAKQDKYHKVKTPLINLDFLLNTESGRPRKIAWS